MGRCPYDLVKNLEPAFEQIRKLEKVKETKPGIFYLKSEGFLHFHLKDNRIWADIKEGVVWGKEFDVPEKVNKAYIDNFVREVKKRHAKCLKP